MKRTALRWALVLGAVVGGCPSAQALQLRYFGETSIATGTKFDKTIIGGLSGITWQNNILYALSDDRGRMGDPRFYEFDLKIDKAVNLTPKAVHFVRDLPKEGERKALLDPEGLVRLANGDFLISSEGSNDAKPRAMPRIFEVSSVGVWKSDLPIPSKYLPEPVGHQSKGVQNNLAFEGLTSTADGKWIFTSIEAPLLQDVTSGKEGEGNLIRVLKFENNGQFGFKPVTEFVYQVDPPKGNAQGPEIMRGVSEILAVSETKLIVLERGVRLQSKGLAMTVTLYLADLSKASNTLEIDKLAGAKFQPAEKTKLIDFEVDLSKERPGKTVQNFEALSWGPTLPDGRRSLLMMVDNNFSKRELTEFVVFAVEGE